MPIMRVRLPPLIPNFKNMKSIIIKQNGVKIIHIKRTKKGVDIYGFDNILNHIEIKVILNDSSIIIF